MNRRISCLLIGAFAWGVRAVTVENLRCEYRVDPLGVGEREPRLSWVMRDESGRRGAVQTAYQILVASTPEKLASEDADLWDSGRVRSAKSIQIAYGGRPLVARDRCFWKVCVWDGHDEVSPWSGSACWTMGLLHVADWQAEWLRVDEPDPHAAPPPPPPKLTIVKATYGSHGDQRIVDVTEKVRELVLAKGGVLLVQASNGLFGDPAVGGGKELVVAYDLAGKRQTVRAPENQFVTANADEWAEPPRAKRLQTPRYLRRVFTVTDRPVRATLYATALGLYEMRLNGQRVGDALLTPEWTAYDKRVQVQAYDVTARVQRGANALGALLGNGWYCGTVQGWPPDMCLYGYEPHLKAQLELTFADGRRQTVATDENWLATTDGPLRFSGVYEGETYDARKEMEGWDEPGFAPDARWQPALIGRAVQSGAMVWQRSEPIRVTRELKAVAVTEPKPGVFVFDFGQNRVGWTRLAVQGEAGTTVEIFHNEMLNPDGTVYRDSPHAGTQGRAQSQIDRYTLRGGGAETFEPHFTYHGFRYAEVTGLKSKPDAALLTGRVFHTAFAQTGSFACSDPLVTRLAQSIQWRPDEGFRDPNMNAFNQSVSGSCGHFFFECVGGIFPLEPGYQFFAVAPVLGGGLMWAKTSYRSMYGEIVSEWKKKAGSYDLNVTVPPNTRALIRLPVEAAAGVTEGGMPLTQAAGLELLGEGQGSVRVRAGAGVYAFVF